MNKLHILLRTQPRLTMKLHEPLHAQTTFFEYKTQHEGPEKALLWYHSILEENGSPQSLISPQ